MSSLSIGFESLLVCPVCLDAFKEPKVLPCLHTFCAKCIGNCCKPLRREVRCPVCKSMTLLGSGGVINLPNDFKVQQLKDAISSQKNAKAIAMSCDEDQLMVEVSTETSVIEAPTSNSVKQCDACNPEHPIVANWHCIQCSLNLCNCCHDIKHKNNRMFDFHQTVSLTLEKLDIDYNCECHQGQTMRYYCVYCVKSLCCLCVMAHDTNHQIESIDKKSIAMCSNGLEILYKKIENRNLLLRRNFDSLKGSLKREHDEINRAQEEIKNRAVSLIDLIKSQELIFQNELQVKKNSDGIGKLSRLNEKLQLSQEMKSNITNVISEEVKSPMKCFQLFHDLKHKMMNIEDDEREIYTPSEIYTYITNDNLHEITTNIRSWFGYLKSIKTERLHLDERKRQSVMKSCAGPSRLKVKYSDPTIPCERRQTYSNTYNCDALLDDNSDNDL